MPQSYTGLRYHIVFSIKDREPWLDTELRPRLWECLRGAIYGGGGFRLLANGLQQRIASFCN
ncbi:MAG: hypothetical protein FJW26_08790 [Acidimicrobiia bacterium]|nr:hypothetical protein [Acidimicrobiia bacterium]